MGSRPGVPTTSQLGVARPQWSPHLPSRHDLETGGTRRRTAPAFHRAARLLPDGRDRPPIPGLPGLQSPSHRRDRAGKVGEGKEKALAQFKVTAEVSINLEDGERPPDPQNRI